MAAEMQIAQPDPYYVNEVEILEKIHKNERVLYVKNTIKLLASRYSGFSLFVLNTLLFFVLLTFTLLPTSWCLALLHVAKFLVIKVLPFIFAIVLFSWTAFILLNSKKDFSKNFCLLYSIILEILLELHYWYGVVSFGEWTICGLVCVAIHSWRIVHGKEHLYTSLVFTLIVSLRYLFMKHVSFIFGSLFLYIAIFTGLFLPSVVSVVAPPKRLLSGGWIDQDGTLTKEVYEMSKVPMVRRRRASSIEIPSAQNGAKQNSTKTRRKSLPALGGQNKRTSMSNLDLSCLGEAHGMITDLLVDSSLPPNVIGTLRIVADMISPLLQQGFQRQPFNNPLITVFEKSQSQEDQKSVMNQPDLKDDTPLSLKQRLQRNLGVSSRRMSSSYTTTTSATGMPTIDIEYPAKTTSSPNNKASHRSKSYAGMGLKSQKERYRTLSHKTISFSQEPQAVSKNIDKKLDDDIFKVEINRGEPVYFDGMSKSESEDDEMNALHEQLVDDTIPRIKAKKRMSPPKNETLEKVNEIPYQDSIEIADKLSKNDLVNKPSISIECKEKLDKTNCESIGTKCEYSSSQPPPLTQRSTNPNVAEVSPVRKTSITDDRQFERKGSIDGLSVPSNTRRRSSRELHLEYEVSISKAVDTMLCKLIDWDFPIFELSEKCNVLTQVAFRIFQVCGFITKFKIPEITLLKYFRALESGYHNIPYHNRIHAADVLHGVYYLTQQKIPGFNSNCLSNCSSDESKPEPSSPGSLEDSFEENYNYGCMANVMPDLELMALYTAAAMHDFDHPGRTNAFLVATLNPKALLYNDRSVLENHHAAAAWSLMITNPGLNFLTSLDTAEFKRFRFIVIEEILSTDLKKHFDFLAEWNAKISNQGSGLNFSLEADRLLVGQMALKVADISGPSKEWTLHNRWTDRIIEEFYQQGEDERTLGMPMSAYMDRDDPKVPELQASFIKHLVSPLYLAYEKSGIFPGEWVDVDDTEDGNPADDEDENSSDGSSSEKPSKIKKKIIYNVLVDNLEKNHEQWLTLIAEKEKKNSGQEELRDDQNEDAHIEDEAEKD